MNDEKLSLWHAYLDEKMPGWKSDKWVAIILGVSVCLLIYGIVGKSTLILISGLIGLAVDLATMSYKNERLGKLMRAFNKEFPDPR